MSGPADQNLRAFSRPQVVAAYEKDAITPPERHLFGSFLVAGFDVLDLGVGAGRTTTLLAGLAGRYVGVDYALPMVEAARVRHPGVDLRHGDAAHLSDFADQSFDAVVFSFDGLDYLHPLSARRQCFRECSRVLRPGGVFIFSSHHARYLFGLIGRPESQWRSVRAWCAGIWGGMRLVPLRVTSPSFWRGHGYAREPAHGGLVQYEASPSRVEAEVAEAGLRLVEVVPATFPRRPRPTRVPWYYYAFGKPGGV